MIVFMLKMSSLLRIVKAIVKFRQNSGWKESTKVHSAMMTQWSNSIRSTIFVKNTFGKVKNKQNWPRPKNLDISFCVVLSNGARQSFMEGKLGLKLCYQPKFEIFLILPKILSLTSFRNSRRNSYTKVFITDM